jgi:hypothetical protein
MSPLTTATVFGIDVWSDQLPEVVARSRSPLTGRSLDLTIDRHEGTETGLAPGAGLLGIQRGEDGEMLFSVERHTEDGYLLSGERYGAHLLSADGLRLRCVPKTASREDWQRFLIAQVLPFAAVLKGLEVFHAGAVAIDGRAIALLGPAGAGKTTLAVALSELGASFFADDVVAIEAVEGALVAYPGSPMAGVGHGATERMRAMQSADGPLALTDVFCLQRLPNGPAQPSFEPIGHGGVLLSSTFNLLLREPERMRRLLDVCALAARRRVEWLRAGPDADPVTLARAVIDRVRSL